jgi:hypothetical protein
LQKIFLVLNTFQTLKFKNMKTFLSLIIAVGIFSSAHSQITVGGVSLPSALKVADKVLPLNGAGIRKKLFIEVYVGGLYLTTKSNNGDAIAKTNEPMAMRIAITSGMVTSEKMAEATKEGFAKSTGGKTAPIQDKVDKFLALFKREPIVKGDVYDFVYLPASGVSVSKNGKLLDVFAGQDFKTALFGIWLGNDPVDSGLKTGLLGS